MSQVLSEYDVDVKFIETYRYKRCTVLKKIILSTILLVVLTGCGTHEAEVTTEQPAEEVTTQFTTETIPSDELSELNVEYDDTIEYGIVYAKNSIVVETTDYSHTETGCEITFKISNNSEQDITLKELSYSFNNSNYPGNPPVEGFTNELIVEKVTAGDSVTAKVTTNNAYFIRVDSTPKLYSFLFEIINNDTNKIIDTALFDIKTSKYAEVPVFGETELIEDNEYFEYSLGNIDNNNVTAKTIQFTVYNKTDSIMQVRYDNLALNGIDYPLTDNFEENSYKAAVIQDLYIFPHCLNTGFIAAPIMGAEKKGIKKIESFSLDVTCKSPDMPNIEHTETINYTVK